MADQYGKVAFVLDLILGECVLSDSVLNSFGRNAEGEEAAIFDNLDYKPLWWLRPQRARMMIADFAGGWNFRRCTATARFFWPRSKRRLPPDQPGNLRCKTSFWPGTD